MSLSIFLLFVYASAPRPKCIDLIIGKFKKHKNRPGPADDVDAFLAVPFDVSYHVAEQVDFFTLSGLLRKDWHHPLTDAVKPVLMGRLIPGLRKIDWFDTIDATRVFQNPMKIRRFFEVMRYLYPDFDAACADFRVGNRADVPPQMWRFLSALNDKARETLSYFFAADPAQHDAIMHSQMHTPNSISQLEEAMHRTLWRTFDSPDVDRTRDFGIENPAATEEYIVFEQKISAMHRVAIHPYVRWKFLRECGYFKIRPAEMPDGYSRMEVSFKDPFYQEASIDLAFHGPITRLFKFVKKSKIPQESFVPDDVQGFLPQGALEHNMPEP